MVPCVLALAAFKAKSTEGQGKRVAAIHTLILCKITSISLKTSQYKPQKQLSVRKMLHKVVDKVSGENWHDLRNAIGLNERIGWMDIL